MWAQSPKWFSIEGPAVQTNDELMLTTLYLLGAGAPLLYVLKASVNHIVELDTIRPD